MTNEITSDSSSKLEEFQLHQCIGYTMNKLSMLMQTRLEAALSDHGITRVQWMALSAIEIEKKCSPSDLADHIGVSRPAISRTLKQLESIELVERILDDEDGRIRQLKVTEKGCAIINLCWPHVHESEQYFLNKVDESGRAALCATVRSLLLCETAILDKA